MIKRISTSVAASSICLGLFVVSPADAQVPVAPATQDAVSQHHQKLYQMMKDMTLVMGKMTEQMSRGIVSPEVKDEMSRQMASMAAMMQRMSGLEARPAMTEAHWQKQMDEMRRLMDGMMRDWQMAPATK